MEISIKKGRHLIITIIVRVFHLVVQGCPQGNDPFGWHNDITRQGGQVRGRIN